jgi:hypothetical protein
MSTPQRRPSARGAGIAGDDYQHLYSWLQALSLRQDPSVIKIGLEVGGGHNVDDVVVFRREPPSRYYQIKFVTDQREALTYQWFMTAPPGTRKSPLQRFHASFVTLTQDGVRPEMVFETNRLPAAGDPILTRISGAANLLVPRLFEDGVARATSEARAEWAAHLEITDDELAEMLAHLQIRPGRLAFEELREHCSWRMGDVGLKNDLDSVDVGMNEMSRLVREGVRELDAEGLQQIIDDNRLEVTDQRATLLVQQLDHDPAPEYATAALDWVALFDGDEPGTRRQLRDPSGWNAVLRPQIQDAVGELRGQGVRDVLLAGKMRLSVGMLAGFELRDVAGFSVAIRQRDQEWQSAITPEPVEVEVEVIEIGRGAEVAVGLSVSAHVEADVRAHIARENLQVGKLVIIKPPAGVGRYSISSAAEALGLANAILDTVRAQLDERPPVMHLFQAGPLGLAVLLGHLWNHIPDTVLYEGMGGGRGYAPTFTLPG